jgi:hypothetical protein
LAAAAAAAAAAALFSLLFHKPAFSFCCFDIGIGVWRLVAA